MTCNKLVCRVLFGLLESSKITLFKDLIGKIIAGKVPANGFFFALFRDFELNYLYDKIFK